MQLVLFTHAYIPTYYKTPMKCVALFITKNMFAALDSTHFTRIFIRYPEE